MHPLGANRWIVYYKMPNANSHMINKCLPPLTLAALRIEPKTSRTLNQNHTTRTKTNGHKNANASLVYCSTHIEFHRFSKDLKTTLSMRSVSFISLIPRSLRKPHPSHRNVFFQDNNLLQVEVNAALIETNGFQRWAIAKCVVLLYSKPAPFVMKQLAFYAK